MIGEANDDILVLENFLMAYLLAGEIYLEQLIPS